MSLLSPKTIHAVLKETEAAQPKADASDLGKLLAKHSLTPDDALENLRSNMVAGDSAATRLRATETALRLNGLLDSDQAKPDFHVTINILDSEFAGVNPILIPR